MTERVRTEIRRRAHDNRLALYSYLPDPNENIEDWKDREMLFPMRWVLTKVYDWEVELR
jgi:hypothetical protein